MFSLRKYQFTYRIHYPSVSSKEKRWCQDAIYFIYR
jgi:hypothetical protein